MNCFIKKATGSLFSFFYYYCTEKSPFKKVSGSVYGHFSGRKETGGKQKKKQEKRESNNHTAQKEKEEKEKKKKSMVEAI